ncbi:hypothetical protein NO995_16025 [Aestuariibaculum sp. M13]|uniref:hypothetical protein n=1 Tax=Aestuariibaculum sp. M13 TaxID=2967132 RepID=UPI002159EE1D|nr:hypothetical protein [Aestuariibaculum sp. M13]MCR8669195.1 hypothetical protein [Aestuariibaculum sp. M13]
MNFIKINHKKIIISAILITSSIGLFFVFWLNSVFSVKESDNKRIKQLFEFYTQTDFPKSGVIINKDSFIQVLSDGWETSIIKVNNITEFEKIINKLEDNKSLIKAKVGESGFGFSSKITYNKTKLLDSTYYKQKGFILGYIKHDNIIILEKYW